MSLYKYTKLRNLGPVHGFLIHTPDDRKLKDVNPQFIVRELNRMADSIKRLEAVVNDPHALWANWLRGDVKLPEGIGDVRQYQDRVKQLEEENNELRAEEARLLNTNGELERRIKRLIDAGDAMFPWSERVGQEFWNQAKEAKL